MYCRSTNFAKPCKAYHRAMHDLGQRPPLQGPAGPCRAWPRPATTSWLTKHALASMHLQASRFTARPRGKRQQRPLRKQGKHARFIAGRLQSCPFLCRAVKMTRRFYLNTSVIRGLGWISTTARYSDGIPIRVGASRALKNLRAAARQCPAALQCIGTQSTNIMAKLSNAMHGPPS